MLQMKLHLSETILLRAIQVGILLSISSLAFAAEFSPLGFLPGADLTRAVNFSADGRAVVGISTSDAVGHEPFYWTQETGITSLEPVNIIFSPIISADGQVVVYKGQDRDARVWSSATGLTTVPLMFEPSSNNHISADGEVIVAMYTEASLFGPLQATR